jgi:hypothetical protein
MRVMRVRVACAEPRRRPHRLLAQSWLEWLGWRRLLFGAKANRQWHYTRDGQPARYVRWYIRSATAPTMEVVGHLAEWVRAKMTGTDPYWVVIARADAAHLARDAAGVEEEEARDDASASPSMQAARRLRLHKRLLMSAGVLGLAATWALFIWFIFAYGMLVYELLGERAEQSFARSWGVSYGLQALREWKAIFQAALKAALVVAVLERLFLTPPRTWLEEAVDYHSVQALLFRRTAVGFPGQVATFFRHTRRLAD